MARKSAKPAAAKFKTSLPYATHEQAWGAIDRFEMGVGGFFKHDGECFEVWEDEDSDGNRYAVIFHTADGSGDCNTVVFAQEAREMGWIA